MLDEQGRTPLFDALRQYADQVKAPLHVPGHKLGQAASPAWRAFLGEQAFSIDLTEAPGLDDLHAPEGVIHEAQQLAARAFGAASTYFLVGGTTAGLHALVLTACQPGETIAVPRNAHRSVLGALILSGSWPAWIGVHLHDELDIATHLKLDSLEQALGGAVAALLVHPTYHGLTGKIRTEIEAIRRRQIPVLVDEAHGSHFGFHPALPPSALSMGADGVVQSMHKTGGSLTQSSFCHLGKGHRLKEERLREMLRLVQSTSPSYLLMASLDMARQQLALEGKAMWERALLLASAVRRQIEALPGIRLHLTADPCKLLIDVQGRHLTGFQASEWLWQQGVAVETAGMGYVLAVLTPGDTVKTVQYLIKALASLPIGTVQCFRSSEPPWPQVLLSPRDAYLGPKEMVPLREARGRIAAELVAPYPPGIPVLTPGELLTADVISYLSQAARAGHHLQGPADRTLHMIQVVRE